MLLKNPSTLVESKTRINTTPQNPNAVFYGQKIGKSAQGNYARQFAENKLRNSNNFNSNDSRNHENLKTDPERSYSNIMILKASDQAKPNDSSGRASY